jgi:predicted HTH domain antitoxin
MIQVQLSLPESVFSVTRSTPDEFVQEMRLAAAVKWYEVGTVSQSKAVEIAGISRQAFLDALIRFEVSPFQTTPDELAEEFERG